MGHCAEFVQVGFYRNISLILMLSRSHMHRLGPVLYPLDVRHVETCREALAASSDCEIGQTFNITLCYHQLSERLVIIYILLVRVKSGACHWTCVFVGNISSVAVCSASAFFGENGENRPIGDD